MSDGMTDDDRRWLERRVAQFPPATYASNIESALLAEAARTDDLERKLDAQGARLDEALTLLADRVERVLDDDFAAFALRGLAENAGGGEDHGPESGQGLTTRPSTAAPSGSSVPERYVCSDGVTREPSDEYRPPQVGEWYLAGNGVAPMQALTSHRAEGPPCRILRPVQDPAPAVQGHGATYDDALAAAEARARKAEADNARLRDGIEDEAAYLADRCGVPNIARRLRALLDPPGADQ